MIRTAVATIGVALWLTALSGSAPVVQAQGGVVMVDVNRLFEAHPAFKPQLDRLRTEAEALQSSVAQQRQQLQAQAENLALVYQAGTTEFSEKEKSLAMENARIELDARDRMRTLMRREARLHYDVYNEIIGLIAQYCRTNQVPMVLRTAPAAENPGDPEAIMRLVNAEIVWSRPDRDITPEIQALIASAPAKASSAPPSAIK